MRDRYGDRPGFIAIGAASAVAAIVALRIANSLAWLNSAFIGKDAKLSPEFLSGAGLSARVTGTFVHTALTPGLAEFLRAVVVPNAHAFALLIAIGDLAIGISLSFGLLTRVGGFFAIVRALANVLMVGGAGADTVGFNAMLIFGGAIALVLGAGRSWGIDRVLLTRWPQSALLRLLA